MIPKVVTKEVYEIDKIIIAVEFQFETYFLEYFSSCSEHIYDMLWQMFKQGTCREITD